MADVFISYARQDRVIAAEIAAQLAAAGLKVFYDAILAPGDHWDRRIEDELKQAKSVVVIWSRTSVDRQWVRNEARFALHKGNLFPLRIDDCELPLEFNHCQTVSVHANEKGELSGGLSVLTETLKLHVPLSSVVASPPKEVEPREPTASSKVCVLGVGGAGGNMLNGVHDALAHRAKLVAVNTDVQALRQSKSGHRLQIGKDVTEGLGASGIVQKGTDSAVRSSSEIVEAIKGHELCIVLAGLGGGTGTGAVPIIASAASELGCSVLCVLTRPFQFEGAARGRKADDGIAALRKTGASGIVISNQSLFRLAIQQTTFTEAFAEADNIAARFVLEALERFDRGLNMTDRSWLSAFVASEPALELSFFPD